MLGKLFGEVLEDVDPRPLEALQSTGAGRLAIVLYGILPQAVPQFVSYTLYRWEVNIRAAAVMGFVGAGGLGQRIYIAISLFHEHQLLTLILAMYVLVTIVDALSAWLRGRLVSTSSAARAARPRLGIGTRRGPVRGCYRGRAVLRTCSSRFLSSTGIGASGSVRVERIVER